MFFFENYYYIVLALQAICVYHCVRKGNQNKWIWIIVFLPIIGCVIYFFSEIVTSRSIQQVSSGMGSVINPTGSLRKLEEQLKFTDTFQNRVQLADAYLAAGKTDMAIGLYEHARQGFFGENEHLLSQLIVAYSLANRYPEIVPIARKIYNNPQFTRSRVHMLYAIALDKTGQPAAAEKEFQMMNGRFGHYEQRYQYGAFLARSGRQADAQQQFHTLINEFRHLSSKEKRFGREWVNRSKEELRQSQK